MPQANDVGRGSLSKSRDQRSEKSPNYVGSITFTKAIPPNTKIWLAGWTKQGDNGPYLSISASEPPGQAQTRRAPPLAARNDLDDEIPF